MTGASYEDTGPCRHAPDLHFLTVQVSYGSLISILLEGFSLVLVHTSWTSKVKAGARLRLNLKELTNTQQPSLLCE